MNSDFYNISLPLNISNIFINISAKPKKARLAPLWWNRWLRMWRHSVCLVVITERPLPGHRTEMFILSEMKIQNLKFAKADLVFFGCTKLKLRHQIWCGCFAVSLLFLMIKFYVCICMLAPCYVVSICRWVAVKRGITKSNFNKKRKVSKYERAINRTGSYEKLFFIYVLQLKNEKSYYLLCSLSFDIKGKWMFFLLNYSSGYLSWYWKLKIDKCVFMNRMRLFALM